MKWVSRFKITSHSAGFLSWMKLIVKPSALARAYRTMAATHILTSDSHVKVAVTVPKLA